MSKYTHLTSAERYQIYILLKEGFSQKHIAQCVGRSPSTMCREIKKHSKNGLYCPRFATNRAKLSSQQSKKAIKVTKSWIEKIENFLKQQWSPEQISGRLLRQNHFKVSHEWIYQHIRRDKQKGGFLYKYLRQSNKKRRKKYGSTHTKGQIVNRVSIDKRPKLVDLKKRFGDFEGDTVIGKNHKQAIVTLVERKSKFTLIQKVDFKTAANVGLAMIQLLKPYQKRLKTITLDNGKEFAAHEEVSKRLNVDIYFAHPYSSWERGLNENTNGLIRQYLRKGSCFANVTNNDITMIQERLNNRPRKSLKYRTPAEVFLKKKAA